MQRRFTELNEKSRVSMHVGICLWMVPDPGMNPSPGWGIRISGPQAKIPKTGSESLEPLRGCCCVNSRLMYMDALAQVLDKWFKTNIHRKAVKRQKDRAPLRQRRPYYPYSPYLQRPLLYDSIVKGSGHPTGFEPQLPCH